MKACNTGVNFLLFYTTVLIIVIYSRANYTTKTKTNQTLSIKKLTLHYLSVTMECSIKSRIQFHTLNVFAAGFGFQFRKGTYSSIFKIFGFNCFCDRLGGVMVSVLESSAKGCGLDPRPVQNNDIEISICCFTAKHLEARSKTIGLD